MSTGIIARGDDWEGLYVDGKLITEGHSIDVEDGMQLVIEHSITSITTQWVDYEWLCDEGSLPDKIEDVKWST